VVCDDARCGLRWSTVFRQTHHLQAMGCCLLLPGTTIQREHASAFQTVCLSVGDVKCNLQMPRVTQKLHFLVNKVMSSRLRSRGNKIEGHSQKARLDC